MVVLANLVHIFGSSKFLADGTLRPSGSAIHTATRHRAHRIGTLGDERQCESVRWSASGSAIGAAGTPKARVAVRLTLPLGIERTESTRTGGEWQCNWCGLARLGTSGSAPYTATRHQT